MQEKKLISAKEVAVSLGITRPTVYRLADQGEIPAYRIGGAIKFDRDEISDYIKKSKIQASTGVTKIK